MNFLILNTLNIQLNSSFLTFCKLSIVNMTRRQCIEYYVLDS